VTYNGHSMNSMRLANDVSSKMAIGGAPKKELKMSSNKFSKAHSIGHKKSSAKHKFQKLESYNIKKEL